MLCCPEDGRQLESSGWPPTPPPALGPLVPALPGPGGPPALISKGPLGRHSTKGTWCKWAPPINEVAQNERH